MAGMQKKIAKYEITGLLGRGAMGAVYLAHDPFIDREVAIKLCTLEDGGTDAAANLARKMFFNEAQSAGALDHPNILRIYDAGETGEEPYIVMEYVEGADTLKTYCDPATLLPIETVARLMCQCAKALDYAHRRGVMHRDIKPANLMLTKDSEIKIGDFGIAQRTQAEKTQLMGTFGSPRYMSPEQAHEDQPVTHQTDLYSVGVVLYELLTGHPPFHARGLAGLVDKILHANPPPIRDMRPEVPESLGAIVRRAMEKNKSRRYQSGAEIAADLAAVLAELGRPEMDFKDLPEEEKFKAARGLRFFNDFSDEEIEEVMDASAWEGYSARLHIISEGVVEQSFYVIVAGDVSVTIGDKEVGSLGKGDCVGEIGYLAKVKRTASVIAKTDVQVMKIDSSLMEWASIPCQMRFNRAFQQTLIERLARTSLELAKHLQ